MPQYLSPGVYVEEVPGTPPIIGVGTSTAGFIGKVNTGGTFTMPFQPDGATKYKIAPINEPRVVSNWGQFENQFGTIQTGNKTLVLAVRGFFENGGRRCHVIRVTDLDDATEVGNALKKFEAIDEIAIVAGPGALAKPVQEAIIDHCESMKDRFAILDGQQTSTITADAIRTDTTAQTADKRIKFSKYAALYFPWIQVNDPVTKTLIHTPPSGHVAGIYARVDEERGVHKAPANEIVRGAVGLEYLVSRNEQDGLNPDGINVIRGFDGNIRVWGARTLGGKNNGEYIYINVRRLVNFLRESIDENTQYVVFEPNAPPLWQKIRRSVRAFLTNVWRDGALFGDTEEQAFYVKCDESTNPQAVRDVGQVITEIGVAVVKPAEFVIFRISQITTS